jgi:hypothetical protein
VDSHLTSGVLTFDLTECSRRRYAATRGIRIEFAVGAVVLGITAAVILVYQAVHGVSPIGARVLYGLPEFATFALAAYLGWGSTKFAPGARILSIGADGVRFDFAGREATLFLWTDRYFRLDLEDCRATPIAQKYGLDGYARIRNRPSTRLTSVALDALVSAAREHRLSVKSRPRGGRWSFAGPLHEWIEIRAPPGT